MALASIERCDDLDWALYTGNTSRVGRGLDQLRKRRQARRAVFGFVAAAACAVAVAIYLPSRQSPGPFEVVSKMEIISPSRQTLADGSVVELGDGAEIAVDYMPGGRRGVRLLRGTAHFEVAHDPSRPFIVEVSGVQVRAVGTAFTIAMHTAEVNVVVTHGRVAIDGSTQSATASVPAGVDAGLTKEPVGAGNLIVVPATKGASPSPDDVVVRPLDNAAMLASQSWRATRLELSGTPLSEVVAAMNRHGGVRIAIFDVALENVRLSGSIRTDMADKLVRVLEADFGVQAEWIGTTEIRLRRAAAGR